MAQDSSRPDFWETRYRDHVTPWDAGRVGRNLQDYARSLKPGTRVLIPGCGSGYEAHLLAEAGCDVLAIDFSSAAVEAAQKNLGHFADRVRLADFFAFDAGAAFDVMIERAFLCALPRKMWAAYAARTAELLGDTGVIAGYWFFDENPKGPPFGTSPEELQALLGDAFSRIVDAPVADSLPVFAGRERWQVWARRRS
ncbi:MAG: methyltransferase domain-containing protein [Burkholderiales bacterium]|nr:methyltransferase domain-containing protein [Burkholderiales bacterium]